jgi:hypothetical protein
MILLMVKRNADMPKSVRIASGWGFLAAIGAKYL